MFNFPIKAASAFILDSKGRVLLLKRSDSVKGFKGYWQLPEGKIGLKESAKQALIRELEEELSYKTKDIIYIGEYKYTHKILFIPLFKITRKIYKADKPGKITLSNEHTEFAWIGQNELSSYNLLPGMRNILSKLSNKNT